MGNRGIVVRFLARARDFSLLHSVQSGHGADQASYTTGILGTSLVIKWLRCKCDHSRPWSPGFRLSGAVSSFLDMPHGAHRENCTLLFSAQQYYVKTSNVTNSLRCLLRSSETQSVTLTQYNALSASDVPTSNAGTKTFSFVVFTRSNTVTRLRLSWERLGRTLPPNDVIRVHDDETSPIQFQPPLISLILTTQYASLPCAQKTGKAAS